MRSEALERSNLSDAHEFLRVVLLRKGRLRPMEFRLREGELGLSVFQYINDPGPETVIEAVRAAGKQGDLVAVSLSGSELRRMGLIAVRTSGGTPDVAVNRIHYEIRLSRWLRIFAVLRGNRIDDYFNDHLSERLCQLAKTLD